MFINSTLGEVNKTTWLESGGDHMHGEQRWSDVVGSFPINALKITMDFFKFHFFNGNEVRGS